LDIGVKGDLMRIKQIEDKEPGKEAVCNIETASGSSNGSDSSNTEREVEENE
jgi:hypothetical protein